ncbi:LOW QUALITY PROTEIN: sodium-coupled monocarboxylate transporter 1-like [Haliotis rubra]|uniref:LOW QUALITY PROTEIN: sodium-coupled monocarboxylate transporter 1-like n=1 Tax=Haliotis rubra TaxID=36100 RepID=UPI001EE4F7EC|nr:LOW QUALITY PROTEIN: sodium-coupled monocarboxylate transporter 1-like [Haliotis rubra]
MVLEKETNVLGVWDYIVFAAMLILSGAIGIYYAVSGGKQKTTSEYLMGDRNMAIVPVAISILVSFMSAILILGTPAEMYSEGTEYFVYLIGMMAAIVIAALLYVPLLYPLKFTSSFEYLEKRFDSRAAKLTGTCIMIIQQVLYMGVASFAPSTALEAVTGFPTWATIITVGMVSTFYTSLGGMKAVVWTDVFQSVVMLAGLLAIVIQGSIVVGGMGEVWRINEEWGRINFFNFDPDPTVRHSFWSLVVGGMIGWTATYGVNQASVQRYCALPTLQKAKLSVMLNVIGVIILLTIVCLAGIIIFAYYAQKGCDPLSAEYISNSNQLIPYFVMEVLGYPGLPGLFVSCLFSGALSTMSSCLNALAAVCWEDFLKPFLGERLTRGQKTLVTKLLVLFFGGAGIGMSFMAMNLGGTVLQASLSFTGAASGPLLGMFALGAFFPWANWIGAVVGGVLGLALPLWISIGAYTVVGAPTGLEFPTYNCSVPNTTDSSTTMSSIVTTAGGPVEYTGISALYTVSYLWYPAIGAATVIVVGLVVSALTGMNSLGDVDTKYLVPFFDRLICCLPGPVSKCLRCNQEFRDPEEIASEKDEEIVVSPSGEMISSKEKLPLNGSSPMPVYGLSYKENTDTKNGFINPGADVFNDEKQQNGTKF